jgi:dihydrofolate synthase/folylpolyglutamate synthase
LKRTPEIRTLEQAGAYLESLFNVEKQRSVSYARYDLEPIRRLTARLGDPHLALSVIHIAGSKGKGSTALFTEALLLASGQRVGTFTSPHLSRWTERFRIDGAEVDGGTLAAAVERVAPHVDALRETDPEHAPTFFDATTATALLLFRDADVDRVVLEVGLGGRLDSTNVVSPELCCITSIELEHTAQLGDTLAQIAAEKAGIIKTGVPVVMGRLAPPAAAVVAERAREIDAPLARLGHEFDVKVISEDFDGQLLQLVDAPIDTRQRIPVLGHHQADNAALALACARRVTTLSDATIRDGFRATRLPGRIEVLGRSPWLIVDSAHTAASAAAVAGVVRAVPNRRTHLVLSISAGKDIDSILNSLVPGVDRVTVTRSEPIRSLAPAEVAAAIRAIDPDLTVSVVPNPHLAIRAARESLGSDDLLCVAGSIYLAGIARAILSEPHGEGRVVVSRRSGASPDAG